MEKRDDDTDGAGPASLAQSLEAILRRQIADGTVGGAHPSYLSIVPLPTDSVPLVIDLTMRQVLDAADDAEIRACVLAGISGLSEEDDAPPAHPGSEEAVLGRRVKSLREAAVALRRISSRLEEDWAETE